MYELLINKLMEKSFGKFLYITLESYSIMINIKPFTKKMMM